MAPEDTCCHLRSTRYDASKLLIGVVTQHSCAKCDCHAHSREPWRLCSIFCIHDRPSITENLSLIILLKDTLTRLVKLITHHLNINQMEMLPVYIDMFWMPDIRHEGLVYANLRCINHANNIQNTIFLQKPSTLNQLFRSSFSSYAASSITTTR